MLKRMKLHKEIIFVLTAFFIVRIFYFLKIHHLIWDETVYVAMGKYMMSLGSQGIWEIYRPLGLPFVQGLFFSFGIPQITGGEIFSILMALGMILLTYLIAFELFDKKSAIVSSIIISSISVFFLYSSYILTEIPSTFFLLLAVYLYIKNKNLFYVGIFASLAFMFKFPHLLAYVVFGILIMLSKNKLNNFARFSFGSLIPFIPFFIFNYLLYNKYTLYFWHAMLRPVIYSFSHQSNIYESVPGFWYNAFFYLINGFKENFGLLFLIPGIFYLIFYLKNRKNTRIIWLFLAVYLIYFTLIINKQVRFFILLAPFASIVAGFGFSQIYSLKKSKCWKFCSILILVVLIYPSIKQDLNYYDWRPVVLPEIYAFYKFFDTLKDGAVLTSNPEPAAYSNKLFIPYYHFVAGEVVIYNEWEKGINVSAIVYTPSAFPCKETDSECLSKKESLEKQIKKNKLLLQKRYYDQDYYVYELFSSSDALRLHSENNQTTN